MYDLEGYESVVLFNGLCTETEAHEDELAISENAVSK